MLDIMYEILKKNLPKGTKIVFDGECITMDHDGEKYVARKE